MIRFYSENIADVKALSSEDSAHCVRVLRKQCGQTIDVVDGKGNVYTCIITDANPRNVKVEITGSRKEPVHWNKKITLAVAPTKNADRMEWLAEKATEMGIDNLVLLRTEHSERKQMKTDRLRRVMISAMKQSLKAVLPTIEGPKDFTAFIDETDPKSNLLIAHCEKDKPRMPLLSRADSLDQDIVIMIGPEGDFSETEIKKALESGFKPITLGQSRLRTETAAMFAIAAIHASDDAQMMQK